MTTLPLKTTDRRPAPYAAASSTVQTKLTQPQALHKPKAVRPEPTASAAAPARISASDLELQERVAAYFAALPLESLRLLRIEVRQSVVVLKGRVANAYERQLAQHYVRRVSGVVSVIDNIAVDQPSPSKQGAVGKLRERVATKRAAFLQKWLPPLPFKDEGDLRGRRRRGERDDRQRPSRLLHPFTFAGVALGLLLIVCNTALSGSDMQVAGDRLPTYRVKGSVALGTEPPKGAFVVFHPLSGSTNAPHPAGYVTKFGDYTLTTYEFGDGAPAGDYQVTIHWSQPKGKKGALIPAKLSSPKTTTLKAHVSSKGNVISQFKL